MEVSYFTGINRNSLCSFKGTPLRIQGINVNNYQDALKCWENLKFAKYLDAHCNSSYDKMIRADNYSFLDKLTSYTNKVGFVEKFCEFTKFPDLKQVSDNINATWKECINKISRSFNNSAYNIIDSGYDPTCSVGLNKAFPGSDLDKGYVILEGSKYLSDKNIVNNFKAGLWNNLDQRIVSLNHPNTYPSVYTKAQIKNILEFLDKKAQEIENSLDIKAGVSTFIGLTAATLLGPFGIMGGCALAGLLLGKHFQKATTTTDPYEAAKFNRKIAEKISDKDKREEAKNFAFFIEIARANLEKYPHNKSDSIFSLLKKSLFVNNSNVTQVEAWQHKIANGYMKSKLKHREHLETDFYKMSIDTKYDLIKDVIKYGTDEQSSKFSEYFKNDDDIANRYERLLNSLK